MNKGVMVITFLLVSILSVIGLSACAGDSEPTTTIAPSETVLTASELFIKNCAPCHGADRQGIEGPAITKDSPRITGLTEVELAAFIATHQPQFNLVASQRTALAVFLKTT
ncbi:hypothetical protein DGWBC_0920 [Dehalogenimonas sp. WBC-2]|nr:hypothetical protein DGWBC_0920 [Dehalogenimonas sp. WBC-2]